MAANFDSASILGYLQGNSELRVGLRRTSSPRQAAGMEICRFNPQGLAHGIDENDIEMAIGGGFRLPLPQDRSLNLNLTIDLAQLRPPDFYRGGGDGDDLYRRQFTGQREGVAAGEQDRQA